jgi:hypothetical protein
MACHSTVERILAGATGATTITKNRMNSAPAVSASERTNKSSSRSNFDTERDAPGETWRCDLASTASFVLLIRANVLFAYAIVAEVQ